MPTESKTLQKAQKLVALANSAEEEEARTAAVQLARLMKEEELVLVPKSEIDRVNKVIGDATALAKQQQSEGMKKMMVGAVVGALILPKLGVKL